jgi:hypothetical protein
MHIFCAFTFSHFSEVMFVDDSRARHLRTPGYCLFLSEVPQRQWPTSSALVIRSRLDATEKSTAHDAAFPLRRVRAIFCDRDSILCIGVLVASSPTRSFSVRAMASTLLSGPRWSESV